MLDFNNLSHVDKEKILKMEQLDEIGKAIHFSWDLCDEKTRFLLRKKCNHRGGVFTHEFGIYRSLSGENIYFHRCDNCMNAIRISEQNYWKAKETHNQGGVEYID